MLDPLGAFLEEAITTSILIVAGHFAGWCPQKVGVRPLFAPPAGVRAAHKPAHPSHKTERTRRLGPEGNKRINRKAGSRVAALRFGARVEQLFPLDP